MPNWCCRVMPNMRQGELTSTWTQLALKSRLSRWLGVDTSWGQSMQVMPLRTRPECISARSSYHAPPVGPLVAHHLYAVNVSCISQYISWSFWNRICVVSFFFLFALRAWLLLPPYWMEIMEITQVTRTARWSATRRPQRLKIFREYTDYLTPQCLATTCCWTRGFPWTANPQSKGKTPRTKDNGHNWRGGGARRMAVESVKVRKCALCRQPGHTRRNCPLLQRSDGGEYCSVSTDCSCNG